MSVIVEERLGPIAVLRLNRPQSSNSLGAAGDGDAIAAACGAIDADRSIRCVVLTGAGKAFCAGGDVKAMHAATGDFAGGPARIREAYRSNIHRILRALHGLDVPLIAAVNGAAIGLGCDLACLADFRIASDRASFGATFLKLGLVPGDGGSWLLPRVIGPGRAAELLFTGEVIDAPTAERWGLVGSVVPHAELMDAALARAEKVAALPPDALRLTKSLLRQASMVGYDTALEMAASAQAIAHMTADHREGVEALLERRQPRFTGD